MLCICFFYTLLFEYVQTKIKEEKTGSKDRFLAYVLVASMNKGLFPFAMAGFIFIIMIIKMPTNDVSKLVFKMSNVLMSLHVSGYIIAGIMAMGWMFHSKWQRKIIHIEMKRIAEERDKLQNKLLGGNDIQSSEE